MAAQKRQCRERSELVGHIARRLELRHGQRPPSLGVARGQEIERHVAKGATACARSVRRIGAGVGKARVDRVELQSQRAADFGAKRHARVKQNVGIDVGRLFAREVDVRWQRQRLRDKRRIVVSPGQQRSQRLGQPLRIKRAGFEPAENCPQREALRRLPAIERVVVKGKQALEIARSWAQARDARARKSRAEAKRPAATGCRENG